MSFTAFDSKPTTETCVDELLKAGVTPDPEVINSYNKDCGGLAVAYLPLPSGKEVVRLTRTSSYWLCLFQDQELVGASLDETLPFKEFSARADVKPWGTIYAGWSDGYILQSQEALNEIVKLVRTESVYLMTYSKNKAQA
jgi:hypothetical protein